VGGVDRTDLGGCQRGHGDILLFAQALIAAILSARERSLQNAHRPTVR
jgi:hypothetical protein